MTRGSGARRFGLANPGAQLFDFGTASVDLDTRGCDASCPFSGFVARGDEVFAGTTVVHMVAEKARNARRKRKGGLSKILPVLRAL